MQKKLNIVISLIGVVLLVLGYLEYNKYRNEQNSYGVVEATINEVKVNGDRTIVGFEFLLNENYYFTSITTEESFEVGDKAKIFYLKNNPESCKLSLMTATKAFMYCICGILIFLLGFVMIVKRFLINIRIKHLKKKGLLVKATIQEVLVVNKNRGKNPYKIRACYYNPQDNKNYFFVSEEEETDLKDLVSKNNIQYINVYINKKNTDDYYVDIESIKL